MLACVLQVDDISIACAHYKHLLRVQLTHNVSALDMAHVYIQAVTYVCTLSLSTIVLNSRDWSEIIWLPKISRLKSTLQ